MKAKRNKLHFKRYEFKYVIDEITAKQLRDDILPFMQLDPHVTEEQPSYTVQSLYFESPHRHYFDEKESGVKERRKVRLRTYNFDKDAPVFLEIKRKTDAVVLKDRLLLKKEQLEEISEELYGRAFQNLDHFSGNEFIEEIKREAFIGQLNPFALVVYDREPYMGKYDEGFRVTFDRNIRVSQKTNLHHSDSDDFFEVIPTGQLVLEVKINNSLPTYFQHIIRRFNLDRSSYSKYCRGVDCLVQNNYGHFA